MDAMTTTDAIDRLAVMIHAASATNGLDALAARRTVRVLGAARESSVVVQALNPPDARQWDTQVLPMLAW